MIKDNRSFQILVIEDNPGDFTIVKAFLLEQILTPVIVQAQTFKQASTILSLGEMIFDVILLDLTLPDKSGEELVTKMLRLASSSPVIVLTGHTNIDFSIKSITLGVSDYLIKDDLTVTTIYKSIIYSIERKKITFKLKESEKRYSDLFRLSPQPMYVYDLQTFCFVQVNRAAIKQYGYTEEEFLDMKVNDIGVEEETGKGVVNIQSMQANGGYTGKVLHAKKSGEIMEVDIFCSPMIIDHKKFLSVIAIDVTEKNLYEHKMIKAIIKTQEDERYEIGGELHDNVCQLLATSQLSLGMLKQSMAPSGLEWFTKCKDYIGLALDEIRNLSHRLAPAFFNNSDLEEAFELLLRSFNVQNSYQISLHFDAAIKQYSLTLELQLNLYRILQEQLKNILKYADAASIAVDVLLFNNKLKMRIVDDGKGFNTDTVKYGIGMANMKRRTELFYGKFFVDSSPGNGCEIIIEVPFTALGVK